MPPTTEPDDEAKLAELLLHGWVRELWTKPPAAYDVVWYPPENTQLYNVAYHSITAAYSAHRAHIAYQAGLEHARRLGFTAKGRGRSERS